MTITESERTPTRGVAGSLLPAEYLPIHPYADRRERHAQINRSVVPRTAPEGGNHLRRNPGQGANSSVSRLNASLSSRALQTAREPLRGRIRLVRRKQRLRTTLSIVTARAWMPENRGILSTIHPSNA